MADFLLDGSFMALQAGAFVLDTPPSFLAFVDCCCPDSPELASCCQGQIVEPPSVNPKGPTATRLQLKIVQLTGNANCWGGLAVNDVINIDPYSPGIWRSLCLATNVLAVAVSCDDVNDRLRVRWNLNDINDSGCPSPVCPFDGASDDWTYVVGESACSPFKGVYTYTFNETPLGTGGQPCADPIAMGGLECDSAATIKAELTIRP